MNTCINKLLWDQTVLRTFEEKLTNGEPPQEQNINNSFHFHLHSQ